MILDYVYYKTQYFQGLDQEKESREVKTYSGMAYLNDQNIEKFVSRGQHFIMFYAPWCKASQVIYLQVSYWSNKKTK